MHTHTHTWNTLHSHFIQKTILKVTFGQLARPAHWQDGVSTNRQNNLVPILKQVSFFADNFLQHFNFKVNDTFYLSESQLLVPNRKRCRHLKHLDRFPFWPNSCDSDEELLDVHVTKTITYVLQLPF